MICSRVNRLSFMSISPFEAMDSTHFWRRFRGSGHEASTPNLQPPTTIRPITPSFRGKADVSDPRSQSNAHEPTSAATV
jgi:hypothetical protein